MGAAREHVDRSTAARRAAHGAVAGSLALRGDHELRELVDGAQPLGSGIGGRTALLQVAGTPVFVKLVPLTALETRPEHTRSTANVFSLPAFCHYGIGSPGFGAWRELAVHTMTTDWVLAGEHSGFPLTYHWRVLPNTTAPGLPEDLADVAKTVAYWGGGPGVRERLEALRQAPAHLALFLEYLPQTLGHWLGERLRAGGPAADRACAMVERELASVTSFMHARGLLHFDAHFENILTDGRRLYFADYGLAFSSRFELEPPEAEFFEQHRSYDRCYTITHLVHWLVTHRYGHRGDERDALIRAFAEGEPPQGLPGGVAALLTRHAPLATVMSAFYRRLQREDRKAPYPLEQIRRTAGEVLS